MPLSKADPSGTQLYYTDTGPVPNSTNYTTLVVIHGTSFNGGTFKKLPPLGLERNLRSILVNRREYNNSTPFTDSIIADLNAGKKSFLEVTAKDLVFFLVSVAEGENIPKASLDGKEGGLALMGWSMGCHVVNSIFGQSDAVPADMYARLTPYLRHVILYDPPFTSLGYPTPTSGYHPFRDPTFTTIEAKVMNFGVWVSEYYKHPGYDERDLLNLDFRRHGDDPSVKKLTPNERAEIVEKLAVDRVDLPVVFKMQNELGKQTNKALFNPELALSLLSGLPFTFLACKRSNWYCVYSLIESEKRMQQLVDKGTPARSINFVVLEGANHFVHWDNPPQLMDAVGKALDTI